MAFVAEILSLSALNPVKMVYQSNSTEQLKSSLITNSNNLNFIKHELFVNAKDTAISKHTLLALTDQKNLKNIFANQQKNVDVKHIAGTFYLNVNKKFLDESETTVKFYNNNFWVGGKGETAIFHIVPIEPGVVELKVGQQFVQCSPNYPYDMVLSLDSLQEDVYRQRFVINYFNKQLTIQTMTKDGPRYLSSGTDRIMRFTGINLNYTKINDYLLPATFLSPTTIYYDFDPSTREVRYYNETSETDNQKTLAVKIQLPLDTNLLVSCPTMKLTENEEVPINISLTKTNFSNSGVFNTTI